MKKYKINYLQYKMLPTVLKVTQAAMCHRVGVTTNYMSRHLQDGDFRLCDAIALCNAYHVRLSDFIVCDDCFVVCKVVEQGWADIVYSQKLLTKRLKADGVSYSRIMKTLHCGRGTVDILLSDNVPLSKLLNFCNEFSINISDFITDDTVHKIRSERVDLKTEVDRLKAENEMLRTQLNRLLAMSENHSDVGNLFVAEDKC